MGGKAKGNSFERWACKRLSEWMSNNKNNFLLWRSVTSGGFSTVRSKKGLSSAGQEGDITAVHDFAKPLLAMCSIECKSGYNSISSIDLIDIPATNKTNVYKDFIEQSLREMQTGGRQYFWLIHKKDRRNITITMPIAFYHRYRDLFGDYRGGVTIRIKYNDELELFTCDFEKFLEWFRPEMVFGEYKE